MKLIDVRKIEDIIDSLLASKGHAVRMDVNAAQCGTRTDWKKAKEAEERLDELRESRVNELVQMMKDLGGTPYA